MLDSVPLNPAALSLDAAGSMFCDTDRGEEVCQVAFFFFGTLMDRDVLQLVLGRKVPDADLAPARLHGWRRVRTAREPYPTLVRDPSGVVEGVCFLRAGPGDESRIRHFENEEYAERWMTVQAERDGTVRARVFFAAPELGTTEELWSLEGWRRVHKNVYLEECRAWMQACPH